MIDLYCERVGPGLWAEPVNAVTNLGYFLAAWLSWRLIPRSGHSSAVLNFLAVAMAFIGIGSGLFHTFATGWAQALDVAPILIFQLSFFWFYFRRIIIFGPAASFLTLVCFVAAALYLRKFSAVLNGSLMYAPAFALLLLLGLFHFKRQKKEPFALLAAAGLFLLALLFRTVDLAVCPYFPIGTHFAWHLLTASVMTVAFKGLASNLQDGTSFIAENPGGG